MRALETLLSRLHQSRFFDHLNRRFVDSNKVAFPVGKEVENDFKDTFVNLKQLFFDFIQNAFWAGQEA